MSRLFSSPYHKSGSILVISMWVLVFFSILSIGLYSIVSSQIRLAKRIEDMAICKYLAKAAITYVKATRAKTETSYDTLYELKKEQKRQLGIGKYIYTLTDEESKININTASAEVIARLPGLSPELAQKIADSSLKPFHLKEEVLLVEGMTEDIFDTCKDCITVYSNGEVNINTASDKVLKALGLDSLLVRTIVNFRNGPDSKEATEDDGIFKSTGEIITTLQSFQSLYGGQEVFLQSLISQNTIATSSQNLSVEIEAQVLDKPAMRYIVIIDDTKTKQWQEF